VQKYKYIISKNKENYYGVWGRLEDVIMNLRNGNISEVRFLAELIEKLLMNNYNLNV